MGKHKLATSTERIHYEFVPRFIMRTNRHQSAEQKSTPDHFNLLPFKYVHRDQHTCK